MHNLLQDLTHAFRLLAKNRGFTAVAVLTLALGIGANTVIFSVVNAVLLRALPYDNADRLVTVWQSNPKQNSLEEAVAPANYLDWKAQNTVFESIAVYRENSFNITGGDRPESVAGTVAVPELFPLLGVQPALGRTFQPGDDAANAAAVVISRSYWLRHFSADPGVIGQKLFIGGQPFSVIGVMPEDFRFPSEADLWITPRFAVPEHPMNPGVDLSEARGQQYLDVIARLKPGVSLAQARAEMDALGARLAASYPEDNADHGISLIPLQEYQVEDVKAMLLMLSGAVGFVLLIACANVANLLMARGASRRKEIAIRTALGAARGRLVRQLLTESLVLAILGGTLGLLVALWGLDRLVAWLPKGLHGARYIHLDGRALGFTLAVSILTGMLFGLIPALQASKTDLNESLKESSRGSSGGLRHNRIRGALVVVEIAMSLILLAGAGLLIKSFTRLQKVDPGYRTAGIMEVRINLPQAEYHKGREQSLFFERVIQQLRGRPEVESAAAISRLPLTPGNSNRSLDIEGRPEDPDHLIADYRSISPDYFKTLGIAMLRGRDFTDRDTAEAPGVVILNDVAARRFWPGEEAIGKRLKFDEPNWLEVVAVVGDIKHFGLDRQPRPEMYVPYQQRPWPFMAVVARGRHGVAGLAEALSEAVWSVDKNQPVAGITSMDDLLSRSVTARRFNMTLLGIFGAVALLLAAVGIYGVMAYSVAQRSHEIGIRMALGAGRSNILTMVLKQGLALALAGLGIGLAAAMLLTRFISSLLFDVSTTDPITFAAISVILTGVALAACIVPARRATKVDPMVALRYE